MPNSHAQSPPATREHIAQVPKKRLLQRWLTFFVGIWVMSLGVALSVHSQLGTAPISSFPAVIDAATPMSIGMVIVLLNIALVVLQILILRRRFKPFQLLQLPSVIVFGLLVDLSVYLTSWVQPEHYLTKWAVVIIGALILGIGVYIQVRPKLMYLPGEGLVMALAQVTTIRFGTLKQIVDWSLVILAVCTSLILLQELVGAREGTVFSAFAVGGVVKLLGRLRDRKKARTS